MSAFFRSKLEAVRRTTPARDIGAVTRAILDEQRSAFRALSDRRKAVRASATGRNRYLGVVARPEAPRTPGA